MTTAGPTSALEAEATGEHYVVAIYEGHDYKLPADAEDWPLGLIANSVGLLDGELAPDYTVIMRALRELLGAGQWRDFVRAFPRRRDLVPASTAFAMAAGFDCGERAVPFSTLPWLLAILEAYPGAVEATLAQFGVSYCDRWAHHVDGRRVLTLRRINVLLSHASYDSPLMIVRNGRRPLSGTEIVLMDVYEAITRTRHPSRPMTAEQQAERVDKTEVLEAERARYRERVNKHQNRRTAALELARSTGGIA